MIITDTHKDAHMYLSMCMCKSTDFYNINRHPTCKFSRHYIEND